MYLVPLALVFCLWHLMQECCHHPLHIVSLCHIVVLAICVERVEDCLVVGVEIKGVHIRYIQAWIYHRFGFHNPIRG